MRRGGLNLSFLRGTRDPGGGPPGSGTAPDSASDSAFSLSRRELLRLAGAATAMAGLAPVAKAVALTVPGAVTFTRADGRAAFLLDGQERWVIDTRRFGGSPRLQVSRTDRDILLALSGARYPGTALPADLTCRVQTAGNPWTMDLEMVLGGYAVSVDLAKWLAGEADARARVRLDHRALTFEGATLDLKGVADLAFGPEWLLRLAGPGIARLDGVAAGDPLISDAVTLLMPESGRPSLLQAPPARRSLIVLERKGRAWSLLPDVAVPAGWKLSADEPFDLLQIETGVTAKGELRGALVAESRSNRPGLYVELAGAAEAAALKLPLASPRFAATLSQGGQKALLAGFSRDPQWLHTAGCSMLVGAGPGIDPFELVAQDGKVTRAACAPALLAVAAPMPGAITEPVWHPEGTRLSFVPMALTNGDNPLQNDLPNIGPPPDQVDVPINEVPVPPDEGQIFVPIDKPPKVILPQNLKVSVVRPEDMLVLTFEFINLNLKVSADAAPALVRMVPKNPAYIIAWFQPQHIAEKAFFEADKPGGPGDEPPTAPPVQARMAGPSRLVFKVPQGVDQVPYTLEALLSWDGYDQSVAGTALPPPIYPELILAGERIDQVSDDQARACDCAPVTPGLFLPPPAVQAPQAPHTAIEAPYRVIISPNKYAGWAHSAAPVDHDGRIELWHTRLGVRVKDDRDETDEPRFFVDEVSDYLRTVRAIWSPDYDPNTVPPAGDQGPFLTSLRPRHRDEIVRLSSDFTIDNYTPLPIKADRLMLSSLGAWLNLHGKWDPPEAIMNLEEWLHRASMGRDTYVKTVERGYLFPFGNKAALFTVTERKFQQTPDGKTAAYLRQRQYVVVRQPEKFYPGPGQAYAGRAMPLPHIKLTTLVTPNLDPAGAGIGGMSTDAYWLKVNGGLFPFHVLAWDVEGKQVEFTMPMAFVSTLVSYDAAKMTQVANDMATTDAEKRNRLMSGQKIAFAPEDKPGDTSFETVQVTFAAEVPVGTLPDDLPRFYPKMVGAKLRVAAIEAMSGKPGGADIAFHQTYLDKGFDPSANKGFIWAALDNPVQLRFPANMSGAVATPNMDVGGLSRTLGPTGGSPDNFLSNAVDSAKTEATQFLSNEAKILGGILLSSIIEGFGLDELGGDGKTAPVLTNRVKYPDGSDGKEDKNQPPIGLETKLLWTPKLKKDPLGLFEPLSSSKLTLSALLLMKFDSPSSPEYLVNGELTRFKIHLIGDAAPFMVVVFDQITFKAKSGEKVSVKPKIDEVQFVGPLKFVEALRDFLKNLGGGFSLDIQPSGVKAGFTLPIPNLAIGVLSITNMKLTAGLTIPFSGDPIRVRFAFCERENPFTLTVSLFGGGGFFAVELGLDKSVLLEASLEFGGQFALDIGVASGGVHIMAGIYFKIENDDCTLTGYLRMGGSLSILGIITLSCEFYMGLTYESAHNKVWGEASLTVKVEILFFSVSVSLHVEKRFKGSGADPTFAQLMDETHWDDYADAFAG